MFSSFLKNSVGLYRNSSRSFSNSFRDNLFKQFQTNFAPATPAFATAGGKTLNDAFYFTKDTGVEDTARQRQYEGEMRQATKEATERINKADEAQVDSRIKGAKPGSRDEAYRQAQSSGDAGKGPSHTRKYEAWTDPNTSGQTQEWAKDAKEKAKSQGQEWTAKMDNPSESQTAAKDKISMSGAAETAKEWAESAKESAQKVASNVDASGAMKNATETAKEWVNAAKEKAQGVNVTETAKDWVNTAKEKVESVGIADKAKDWLNTAKEKVQNLKDKNK